MNTTAVFGCDPYIRCIKGEYEGYDIPVLKTGILLGRDSDSCNLIFEKTTLVSRFHCKITYSEQTGYFVITDLNSTNGVFSGDGKRIPPGEKLILAPDQEFSLCDGAAVFKTVIKNCET